jgi:nucleoside-diphosphate-sugar epimerase
MLNSSIRVAKIFPIAEAKMELLKRLESSSLGYTVVINGYFLDYWVVPHVKSYLGGPLLAIDIENKVAAIPGSGEVPIAFTYSFDIGDFVAALLTQSSWEKESYIIGDKITFNEFLAIAEEVRGAKFETSYDSLETLRAGQLTELPSHVAGYPYFPKPMLQSFFSSFSILFEEGYLNLQPEKTLNDQFPDIKARTVKDLLTEAWQGK